MKPFAKRVTGSLIALALAAHPAFAADKDAYEAVKTAQSIGWSMDEDHSEMVVAVSPVRQTLQIAGSAGTLLGASISAIANEKYRKAIEETLDGYDGAAVFRERLEQRLSAALGERAKRVSPMGSTAGANNVRDVQKERLARLAEAGQDLVLDLNVEYGLFGYQGLLVAKLDAKLYDTDSTHKVWSDSLLASAEYILATDKLKEPTQQLMPNLADPRFSIAEDAIAQWTGDGGATFRSRFEAAADGCISALLMELGLEENAQGAHYLGRVYLMRKEFEAAEAYFKIALKLDAGHLPAKNGLSVTLYHAERIDEAIALAKEIVAADPEFGPAQYNLAWWLGVEKGDTEAARAYFEKAKSSGIPIEKKLAKAMGEK